LIDALAGRLGKEARVSLRANPDVDAETHPYISTGLNEHKFGIDIKEVEEIYQRARWLPNLELEGVSCHIGSQLLNPEPLVEALDRMLGLVDRLRGRGIAIQHLDLGGGVGVGVSSRGDCAFHRRLHHARSYRVQGRNLKLMVEPGRSIVADAGVMLSRVLYRKKNREKEFVILDAAMNDLIRPALYKAHHEILPVKRDERRGTVKAMS
jgi:diaminopimelate decarboxylase